MNKVKKFQDINWQEISKEFPAQNLEGKIWLNNCGVSAPPETIKKEMQRFFENYFEELYLSESFNYIKIKESIKQKLSSLIQCKESEVTLVHNTAEGMNNIALALDFKEGDEVLLLTDEYPSNVYPWAQLYKSKGVLTRFIPAERNPDLLFKRFKTMLTEKTKIVSVSAVHWVSGMPIPLEKMGKHCKENNVLFCVDGAQGVGHVPIDVKKMNIDFMAFSAWKWLMGPIGLAGFYVSEKFHDTLLPVFRGTSSVINDEQYFPYKSKLKPDADKYIYSTPSFADWVFFNSSLSYLNNLGFENVQKRIYELSNLMREMLLSLNFELPSSGFKEFSSGIVSARIIEMHSQKIAEQLQERGIHASLRKEYVRFSVHISNNEKQIEHLKTALEEILSTT